MRLGWQNNPSGKHWKPYDLGLCKNEPSGKNRRKSVDAGIASQPDDTTGIFARACLHATLRLPSPESGITVFTKGEAMPNAH
jgi:hypothetical protein